MARENVFPLLFFFSSRSHTASHDSCCTHTVTVGYCIKGTCWFAALVLKLTFNTCCCVCRDWEFTPSSLIEPKLLLNVSHQTKNVFLKWICNSYLIRDLHMPSISHIQLSLSLLCSLNFIPDCFFSSHLATVSSTITCIQHLSSTSSDVC